MFTHARAQGLSDIGTLPQRFTKISITYKDGDSRGYAKVILPQMKKIVHDYLNNPRMIALASELERGGDMRTLQADYEFLKERIPYVDDDPAYAEVLRSPIQTIFNNTGGDCDDMAIATATLCKIQGFDVVFRVIQWRIQEYTHVYCVVNGINFDLVQNNLGDQYEAEPGIQLRYMDVVV